jgi:thiosulfate/3-mercaptopyruvate sulfurtransferase
MAPQDILITADELAERLASPAPGAPPVRLLDVRWQLGNPDTKDQYLAGHLPGAVFVDLDTELASPPGPGVGRHPLPSVERLREAARSWGIDDGDEVVVYDGAGNYAAARAWWVLTDAGLEGVRVLDGALPAWIDAGGDLETGEVRPEPGTVTPPGPGHLPALDIEEAAAFPQEGVLLDARAKDRYLGLAEPIDPKAGHIPGAVSASTGHNLDATGHFLPAADLRERFEALGIRPGVKAAAYCGSGVTASHEVLALRLAGIEAALYPGSWSQWSNSDRPVETEDRTPGAGCVFCSS